MIAALMRGALFAAGLVAVCAALFLRPGLIKVAPRTTRH